MGTIALEEKFDLEYTGLWHSVVRQMGTSFSDENNLIHLQVILGYGTVYMATDNLEEHTASIFMVLCVMKLCGLACK
jgi:hypothetical protein